MVDHAIEVTRHIGINGAFQSRVGSGMFARSIDGPKKLSHDG